MGEFEGGKEEDKKGMSKKRKDRWQKEEEDERIYMIRGVKPDGSMMIHWDRERGGKKVREREGEGERGWTPLPLDSFHRSDKEDREE